MIRKKKIKTPSSNSSGIKDKVKKVIKKIFEIFGGTIAFIAAILTIVSYFKPPVKQAIVNVAIGEIQTVKQVFAPVFTEFTSIYELIIGEKTPAGETGNSSTPNTAAPPAGATGNSSAPNTATPPAGETDNSSTPNPAAPSAGEAGNAPATGDSNNPVQENVQPSPFVTSPSPPEPPTTNSASFTITASAGPNGSISPSGSIVVPAGTDQTFEILPQSGYSLAIQVDGVYVAASSNSYTFIDIAANHSISVSFSLIPIPGTPFIQ
jgi:hypothetical protein